jgi:HD-GYP domain-containing protein (c-di-GMP phosphodiesterase class II)
MSTELAEFISRKALQQGIIVVNRLFSLMKISQLYDPSNKTYLNHVAAMLHAVNRIIKTDGNASLDIISEALYMNGTRLRPDFSSWSSFRFVIDNLQSRGIEGLTFEPGIMGEEVADFFSILGNSDATLPDPFSEVRRMMEQSGITHIIAQRTSKKQQVVSEDETDQNFAAVARRSFYRSIAYLKTIASQMSSSQLVNAKKSKRIVQSFVDGIVEDESYLLGLTTIKNYDEYTLNHSINVCILSLALGMRLGLTKPQLCNLGLAALFHDMGKVCIPGEIINKPTKLTDEEYEEVKKHAHRGATMLSRIRGLGSMPVRAMLVALQHHQTLDHQGYPKTRYVKEIDIYSKIVSVCDFFDAATSPRVYKLTCLKRDEALALAVEMSGTRFDPLIARAFVDMLGLFPVGSLVLLDTGELAIVWKTNQETCTALRPKVKIITDRDGSFVEPYIVTLMDRDTDGQRFLRTIAKSLNPYQYGIDISSYL